VPVVDLEGGRRRASGRPRREQRALSQSLDGMRATGVCKLRGACVSERAWIGADEAVRACRAMLRRFDVAEQIVMLELRHQKKHGVHCRADDGADLAAA
jgi:hypothetical protein